MAEQKPRIRLESRAVQRGVTAAILAWVFPGAGHWYVGARGRAAIFSVLVLLTVVLGVLCDGNLAVTDDRAPVLSRLQVLSNLALGPMEPALRWSFYGRLVYKGGEAITTMDPASQQALQRRRERTFRAFSGYGSTYLMAAGLMNLLLLLDAWDIGIGRKE